MAVTGQTAVFGVVGHPVRRSLSPVLHGWMLEAAGVDGVYVALDVDPARAREVVPAMRTLGLAGVNLTVPFKEVVLDQLDELDPSAATVGAANVVVRRGDRLIGANTDGEGLVAALRHEHGEVWTGARVLVLGAGGAARAAAHAASTAGARGVRVLNRDVDRAERLARELPSGAAASLDEASWCRFAPEADVVLVCTSGAGAEVGAGWSVAGLPTHAVVCDLNYWHADPPLLAAARRAGRRTQDGLPMLVWQAALAFRWFTGQAVDPAWVLARARAGRGAGAG